MVLDDSALINEAQEPHELADSGSSDGSRQEPQTTATDPLPLEGSSVPSQDDGGRRYDPNLYDEFGVPWKNRAKEYERKYIDTVTRTIPPPVSPAVVPAAQEDDFSELSDALSPQEFARKFEHRILSKIESKIESKSFDTQRQISEQSACARYPELTNPGSPFYKAVVERLTYLQSIGVNPRIAAPNILERTADDIARSNPGLRSGNGRSFTAPPSAPSVGTTRQTPPQSRTSTDLPPLPPGVEAHIESMDYDDATRDKIRARLRQKFAAGYYNAGGRMR
jgi:hypothetical protein